MNIVKQAHEFGVNATMKLAALIAYSTDVHAIGLEVAQGLRLSETYYWDLNDRTRSFQNRIKDKVTLWPNMSQAGNYSCTLHYLKAVTAMGAAAAKASGAATVARMKAMPTDDDCFGSGKIRDDGPQAPSGVFVRGQETIRERACLGPLQTDRDDAGRSGLAALVGSCLSAGEGLRRDGRLVKQ